MKSNVLIVVGASLLLAPITSCDINPLDVATRPPVGNRLYTALVPPLSGIWISGGDLITPSYGHRSVLLPSGNVLIAGGNSGGPLDVQLSAAEVYNHETRRWLGTGSMNVARSAFTMTLLMDGRVLVVGGSDAFSALTTAEVYDPATSVWTMTGSMAVARENHTAVLLPDGDVLVAGGGDHTCRTGCGPYASAERFHPASGSWTSTGSMADTRLGHRAAVLRSGQALVAGGSTCCGLAAVRRSAELYDPVTGTWRSTGIMATPRFSMTLTLLTDGRLLAVGGSTQSNNSGCLTSAELYDPASGYWSSTGSMSGPRCGHSATLLRNGAVLVAGGRSTTELSSAETFDPLTGTWTSMPDMIGKRWVHTATLLPGSVGVLVAGGAGGPGIGRSELYTPRDVTPPVISPVVVGTLGDNGWFTSDVAVSFGVSEPESPPSLSGCEPATVASDTRGITFTCSATSMGGSANASVTVKRDATKPDIGYTGNAGSYGVDQTIAITCFATDALSGVASTTCADIAGPAYSFILSANDYAATARDSAGNTNAANATFTVTVSAVSLSTLVRRFVVNPGVANSLITKIEHGSYSAFRAELDAQSGKKISAADAAILGLLVVALARP